MIKLSIDRPLVYDADGIKDCVEKLLKEQGLYSLPVSIDALVDAIGIKVRFEALESHVSGFLYVKNYNAAIVVNADHPSNRQRFTIAHELGHFILHADAREDIFIDEKIAVYRRAFRNTRATDFKKEKEANRFAAELLMPKQLVMKALVQYGDPDLSDDLTIHKLAKKFAVSDQAFNIRLADLGFFI